jgi:hypothetical protein
MNSVKGYWRWSVRTPKLNVTPARISYGPRTASGEDTYVLYEINVSSVFPLPE